MRLTGSILFALVVLLDAVPAYAGLPPAVPEPATLLLLGAGAAALAFREYRRRR